MSCNGGIGRPIEYYALAAVMLLLVDKAYTAFRWRLAVLPPDDQLVAR